MAARMRWGDALDEDEEGASNSALQALPQPTVTGPDARGIKTYITYRRNEKGLTVKVTTKVRVTKVQKKLYKTVEARKSWTPFGDAVNKSESESVTIQSTDEIPFERVRQQKQTQEERKHDLTAALQGSDKGAVVNDLKDIIYKRRMERALAAARGEYQAEKPPEEEDVYGGTSTLPPAGSKGGWVPPSAKNRAAASGDAIDNARRMREENSLRVTNLSEDTREDDLRDLFKPFGEISRIYIAYDRDTGENRGFGFVNFVRKDSARKAIERLHRHGYDNLILNVEWAQPRADR